MKSFKDFIIAYNGGSLHNDAAWRAYNIEATVRECSTADGLRTLGYSAAKPARYAVMCKLAQEYGIATPVQAEHLVGLWQSWARVANGRRSRGLILREAAQA